MRGVNPNKALVRIQTEAARAFAARGAFGGEAEGRAAVTDSLRIRSSEETLRIARRLMPALGISRLTDITRLDRLGVPVFACIRPRGRVLRVHAGKGVRVGHARVGALMEAVEYAVAESAATAGPDTVLPLRELAAQLPAGLELAAFVPLMGARLDPGRPMSAVRTEDLLGKARVLLPAELVLMPFIDPAGPSLFGWSTDGLAAGNTLDEATLHALLEVLERDAMAMNQGCDASLRLSNADLPPPFPQWALAWQRGGVELIVRAIPNDFELPCFAAYVHEAASLDVNLAGGSGLHPDPQVALMRAITEAAQSRLSTLHGGRDTVTRFYAKYDTADEPGRQRAESQLVDELTGGPRCERFDTGTALPLSSPRAALGALLRRLHRLGHRHVFRHRIDTRRFGIDLLGLHVVRVVVPGCESMGPDPRIGPRLLQRIVGAA